MTSNPQGSSAFDLEEFIIYLSAQLCGHVPTCQALHATTDNRSHYLHWRSPILTPAVQDDSYVSAPHQHPSLVYVDVLFQFARTFCSVQMGGLILEADAAGGRDVLNGSLTVQDLRVLFDAFGYDLFLQDNSQTPAVNVAKALKALPDYADNAAFLTCSAESVSVTLTLSAQASAPLCLYDADRGESDRVGLRLLKRMIKKSLAASCTSSVMENDKVGNGAELENGLLQWKSNKGHDTTTTASALPSSPIQATTAAPTATSATKQPAAPLAKTKKTAAAGPKMAVIRKAPSRANKFGFAGSK